MTDRPVALFTLIFVLLVLGLTTLNGAVIALAIPLGIYLVMALLDRPRELRAQAVRTIDPAHVLPGQLVAVKLSITNQGAQAGEFYVHDSLPAGLELVSGATSAMARVPAGAMLSLEYTVSGSRGEFAFGDVDVVVQDIAGIFQRRALLHATGSVLIRPPVRKLRPLDIRPPRTRGFAGPIPARQAGSGVDFFGLRPYQAGDRMRWVNWRVSARHERSMFTNEFEQERIADIGLILDARKQNDIATRKGMLYDRSIQAAASLADMFIKQGNRVGMLIYGRGREGVFPGYGNVQRERILRALGRTATGHNYALESLDHMPVRFFPAGSQIVFIGPLSGRDDVAVLTRMRARGYSVMVVSPDPIDFQAQALRLQSASADALRTAYRITRLERCLAMAELKRVGVQVVDWRVDQPLDRAMHESLARQPVHTLRPVARL
jgi:uncharacterized protein (DUF58 family)